MVADAEKVLPRDNAATRDQNHTTVIDWAIAREAMTDQPISIQKFRKRKKRRQSGLRFKRFLGWTTLISGCALVFWAVESTGVFVGMTSIGPNSGARQISEYPTLSRVIDADTIVVGDIHVRLDGISAPERGHALYTKGKWFVADLMRDATMVECHLEGRKSYEREIGACFFIMNDGQRVDPQAEAVKAGFARGCPRYSGGRYKSFETEQSRTLPLPPYC